MENKELYKKNKSAVGADEKVRTEQVILDAARKEFFSKGLAGARLSKIAEDAGVSTALLHYYFRTKEALFTRIVDGIRTDLLATVNKAFNFDDENELFSNKVMSMSSAIMDFLVRNPQLPQFMINEVASDEGRLAEYISRGEKEIGRLMRSFGTQINNGVRHEGLRLVDPFMYFVDILALNVFSVASAPLVAKITGKTFDEVIAMRRRENNDIILSRLKQ